MPEYLGVDFLSQALKQKDQFLSRMLINCPEYGETDDIFPVCIRTDRTFPWHLLKAQHEKLPKKDPDSVNLEAVLRRFGRKPERFHNTGVAIEYVPSSNPDSPSSSYISDSISNIEEEIVRDVCDYLNRHQVEFTKHDKLHSSNTDAYLLEEIVIKHCFDEFLRRIPRFQGLTSRLKPRKVADPFIGKDGCFRKESWIVCSRLCPTEKSANFSVDGELPNEQFVKLSIPEEHESEHYKFASPMIGSVYSVHDKYATINCDNVAPIREQNCEAIVERNQYVQELQNSCKVVPWKKDRKYENDVKYTEKPKVNSFLEINKQETNYAAVKNVFPLVLESPPPTCGVDEYKENDRVYKKHLKLQEVRVPLQLSQPEYVLSSRSQIKITREILVSSRLPEKISSLMLVVPDVDDREEMDEDDKVSTLSKEDIHSGLELRLRWNSVPKTLKENVNQLRFPSHLDTSLAEAPSGTLNRVSMTNLQKIPWKNVYVLSNTNASPVLEVAKEITPKPFISHFAIKENVTETNTRPCPKQSSSSGKALVEIAMKDRSMRGSDGSKNGFNIHSGIDDFVMLRTGFRKSTSTPPKAIVKALKIDEGNKDKTDNTITKAEDLKDRIEVVEVALVGELQNVYDYIQNLIRPCLVQLQDVACIAPSYSNSNLTGDYTRFVLKQEEKKKTDLFGKNCSCDDKKYRMLICLHVLVATAEFVRECGIAVALDYMKTMCAQYSEELDGVLDQVTDTLMKTEKNLTSTNTIHPKVTAIHNYVRTWQPQPSSLSLDDKILLMIFRGFQEFSTNLISQLRQQKGLKIMTIERSRPVLNLINNVHVVICDPANIPDKFPWSSFSSFIGLEDKTEWLVKMFCGKSIQVTNFICLQGVTSRSKQGPTEHDFKDDHEVPDQEIYTLIGSSNITKNFSLLQRLEQKCGITIIEREYEKILQDPVITASKMCRQPDLILDQRSCVVIENLISFASEDGYKNIVDKVLSASFKCEMCNIIVVCKEKRNSAYSFVGDVQSNLAKFHGCLLSMQLSFPHFVVDVFYSESVEHTASLVRRLCELTRDTNSAFTKQDWVRRTWLSDECSEHERFLLGFPSLNSFSAQLMLNVLPLKLLLTMSFERLRKALPWIPEGFLKNFKEATDCGSPVEGEDEIFPIQIPIFPDNDPVELEFTKYNFDPVVEDNERDVYVEDTFHPQSVELPSNYFDPNSLPSIVRPPQKQDHDCFKTSISSHYVEPGKGYPQLNEFTSSNTFTQPQTHLDDSFDDKCFFHGKRRRQVRSPVRSTFEEVQTSLISNKCHAKVGSKGKPKLLLRPSNLKRGYEMRDVVGVVQPKPRNMPDADLTKSLHCLSQPGSRGNIVDHQRPKQNATAFLSHSTHEKPQKKRKRLTYEIVPGAKNGQTKLAFV